MFHATLSNIQRPFFQFLSDIWEWKEKENENAEYCRVLSTGAFMKTLCKNVQIHSLLSVLSLTLGQHNLCHAFHQLIHDYWMSKCPWKHHEDEFWHTWVRTLCKQSVLIKRQSRLSFQCGGSVIYNKSPRVHPKTVVKARSWRHGSFHCRCKSSWVSILPQHNELSIFDWSFGGGWGGGDVFLSEWKHLCGLLYAATLRATPSPEDTTRGKSNLLMILGRWKMTNMCKENNFPSCF